MRSSILLLCIPAMLAASANPAEAQNRNLYWGDTHLHTNNSPDAFLMQNRSVSPHDAYRFAKGQPIVHPYTGAIVQINTPLDFLVVSDHAEALGVIRKIYEGDARITETPLGEMMLEAAEYGRQYEAFAQLIATTNQPRREGDAPDPNNRAMDPKTVAAGLQIGMETWREIVDAADFHNEPGDFTAFIGWEWTSAPGGANLHRVVMMREDGTVAKKFLPYSNLQSSYPEDLWRWLDATSTRLDANFLSIPHNSNLSEGMMFEETDSEGRPINEEYARTRMRWEPIVEATQVKGDSETHPSLSPGDEFADFEFYSFLLTADIVEIQEARKGAFVRSALMRGLEIEDKVGVNPYKFGLIGSTDSHTGASTAEEDNFHGKFGSGSTPSTKHEEVLSGATGNEMAAQGLAAVWAEENSREEIFAALQRKEVYSTTGPRMTVRFFGGWDYAAGDADAIDLANIGYAKGVPMGGDLANAPADKAPSFLIHAAKDPVGANLDRVQVVKGWLNENGESQEKVFNVALSDGRVDVNGQAPPVGNTVDLDTAMYTNSIGDPQLAVVWTDPEFNPARRAFYYVRVLQIPTPRHTLYDAVAEQRDPAEGIPTTIQERAYTSPIWYTPAG